MYEGLESRTAEGVASEVREDVGRRTQGKHWDLGNHAAWGKKKKKRHHTCSQKRWRAESLVRWGGYLIDEAVWERCKRVQDCGPGGMLCLWQR